MLELLTGSSLFIICLIGLLVTASIAGAALNKNSKLGEEIERLREANRELTSIIDAQMTTIVEKTGRIFQLENAIDMKKIKRRSKGG